MNLEGGIMHFEGDMLLMEGNILHSNGVLVFYFLVKCFSLNFI